MTNGTTTVLFKYVFNAASSALRSSLPVRYSRIGSFRGGGGAFEAAGAVELKIVIFYVKQFPQKRLVKSSQNLLQTASLHTSGKM
jgi:hypothetical protein